MKKYLMSVFALALGVATAQANPVGESQAKYVGQQFVQANFAVTMQDAVLNHVYTGTSSQGVVSYYVFNVGEKGFVIVSADDNFRPIVGYSEEGIFDPNETSSECTYYLNSLADNRAARRTNVINPTVAMEWKSVTNSGKLLSRNNGRAVEYLVQAKWDQSPAPYNSMCPVEPAASDGHVVTGCVATAMAQLMSYWKYPTQGQGSHSYNHPVYGVQTANFGQTTYNWDNALTSYSGNYTPEEGELVALISYHCGVSVNMNYDWASSDPNSPHQGSGAFSEDVPGAISSYFSYTNAASMRVRTSYTLQGWQDLLKEQFDMGWPVYYAGRGDGGHAFICDGYDDADMFHFNWGWGGSKNGYYAIDALNPYPTTTFNNDQRAIVNFVPVDVYNSTPQAPTNFNVTPADNNELAATVTWTNPSKTMSNANLTAIDQIVVTRNGEVIHTEDNVTPGAAMTFTDNSVPRFDAFNYTVYAVSNGTHGKVAYKNLVSFGPTCNWVVNITKASFNGFRGGSIHLYNAAGTEIGQVTTTNSSIQSLSIEVPLGMVSFGWSAQTQGDAFDMAFTIKNADGNVVYTYNGSSADLADGVFYTGNNGCGNQPGTGVPSNLLAVVDETNPNNILVSWDGIEDSGYGYIVYRNGLLYRLIPEGTSFVDENVAMGGHCYQIGFLSDGGENGQYSNESCATVGDCHAPKDIDFEYTGASYKIKLKWEKPDPADGLSGYYLFRKFGEDGTYERVKLLSASATSYTDNSANQEGDYYYKLYAVYSSLGDCVSAPANWKYDSNRYYIHVPYSADDVNEQEMQNVSVFPNPAMESFTVSGEGLTHVTVCNTLGQVVYSADCNGNSAIVNIDNLETGIYLVRVDTENGIATKRITVIR